MRVVTNEAKINRNRQISHILFFVSLAGMGIGFFYTWTQPGDEATGQLTCLILPLLLLMTITSVRMANTWIREPRPVTVLEESLKGLSDKYTLFHHLLPAAHVLVGPEGVFTLTTVWQERPYRVEGQRWRGDEGLLRKVNGYMRQDLIGNPFQDAIFQAQQMQRLVTKVAPDAGVEVQPVVVMINPKANVELQDPVLPVVYADSKKKPSLRQYLRELHGQGRPTLDAAAMDKIDELYGLMTRQQLAAMLGAPLEEAPAGADEDFDEDQADAGGELGTVYVVRSGQLYYIGALEAAADGALDEALSSLSEQAPQGEVELVYAFDAPNASTAAARLQQRFARKRQKEGWYGLSKKDIAWLQSQ